MAVLWARMAEGHEDLETYGVFPRTEIGYLRLKSDRYW